MTVDLGPLIEQARQASPWDIGNEALYRLCREHPAHTNIAAIVAKVWLIGRSYAAAIERRLEKPANEENDNFYLGKVAPAIRDSNIDDWLTCARIASVNDSERTKVLLSVHNETTRLFKKISGLEKRSLASKYLHFHVPDLFFIYDARVTRAMSLLTSIVGHASNAGSEADPEYGRFVEKCFRLKSHVHELSGQNLTCRQLDNLLLQVYLDKDIISTGAVASAKR